ncbi:MAG: SPFH domain-containing protein [Candidatus Magnetomorum sp.]|nr:SPFH domain-containing protein [Candidatus Magnetomorum sp.]
MVLYIIIISLAVIVLITMLIFLVPATFFTVTQQRVAIIERFGKFKRVARAGLRMKIPFMESIADFVNLKIQQLDVMIETKTLDNVFLTLTVSVQYRVLARSANDAFYKLDNPKDQIRAYVFDVVRAEVPRLELDDVFQNKDDIAVAVKTELSDTMKEFGYLIVKSLVTDIEPDKKVKDSMNEINAAKRFRMASEQKAEAERIVRIKNAEAEAKSTELRGQGLAEKRKAMARGMKDSVESIQQAVPDLPSREILHTLMMSQYIETLRDIGKESNTMMVPFTPNTLPHLEEQFRNAMIASNQMPSSI